MNQSIYHNHYIYQQVPFMKTIASYRTLLIHFTYSPIIDLLSQSTCVIYLMRIDTRDRRPHHVTQVVETAHRTGQTNGRKVVEYICSILEGHPSQLDVSSRSDIHYSQLVKEGE